MNLTSSVTITEADKIVKQTVNDFIKSDLKQVLFADYDFTILHQIEFKDIDSKNVILSARSKTSDFQTVNFVLDDFGIVENMFEAFGYFDESGNLVNTIHFERNTIPDISYIDFTDGHREFLFDKQTKSASQISRWWGRFDSCVGSFNGPTSSNFGNLIFGVVANSVTLGIYTPLSTVLCGIAATASSDPPRTLVPTSTPNIKDLRINWSI